MLPSNQKDFDDKSTFRKPVIFPTPQTPPSDASWKDGESKARGFLQNALYAAHLRWLSISFSRNGSQFYQVSNLGLMAASTNISSTTLSLWDQAFNSLGNDLRNSLNSTRTHKRDILVNTFFRNSVPSQVLTIEFRRLCLKRSRPKEI